MPIDLAARSAALRPGVVRCAAGAAVLLALSGCSPGGDASTGGSGTSSPGAPGPATSSVAPSTAATGAPADTSVSTEQETCARVVETARSAPQRLREDPLALVEEFTALADTAPAELSAQIQEVRDAVDGFRRGERRLTEVVGEVRELQRRCSA